MQPVATASPFSSAVSASRLRPSQGAPSASHAIASRPLTRRLLRTDQAPAKKTKTGTGQEPGQAEMTGGGAMRRTYTINGTERPVMRGERGPRPGCGLSACIP
jgi:hypothetical protein